MQCLGAWDRPTPPRLAYSLNPYLVVRGFGYRYQKTLRDNKGYNGLRCTLG